MKNIWSTLKERRFQSVFIKNLLTVFLLLFVPILVLSLVLILLLNRSQKESLLSQANSELIRISSKTDTLLLEQYGATYSLGYEDSVTGFSRYSAQEFTPEKLEHLKTLQDRLGVADSRELSRNIVVLYRGSRDYIVTSQTALFLQVPDGQNVLPLGYERYTELSEEADTLAAFDDSGDYFTFYSKSRARSDCDIFCFIDISKNALSQYFCSEITGSDGILSFTGEDGLYLAGTLSSRSRAVPYEDGTLLERDGKNYIAVSTPSALSSCHYRLLFPCDDYSRLSHTSKVLLLVILILLLATIVIVSWMISLKLYRPIQIITQLLENPEQGTMDYYRTYCRQYDEMQLILTLIESSYFRHLATSKELEKQNRLLQSAQNYSLAVQMNPHFIFNTLDSINWSVLKILKGENEISSALTDFSKIMRYALNKKGLVHFSEELECAQIYVRLRNTLSSSKFFVSWDISDDILDVPVPFLIIQPILENAVTHGLRSQKSKGAIIVRGSVDNEIVSISIEDNGSGFSPEKLAETRKRMEQDVFANESVHLGIVNTHNRIRLTYGNEWGISIQSQPGVTIVSLRFPKTPPKEFLDNI